MWCTTVTHKIISRNQTVLKNATHCGFLAKNVFKTWHTQKSRTVHFFGQKPIKNVRHVQKHTCQEKSMKKSKIRFLAHLGHMLYCSLERSGSRFHKKNDFVVRLISGVLCGWFQGCSSGSFFHKKKWICCAADFRGAFMLIPTQFHFLFQISHKNSPPQSPPIVCCPKKYTFCSNAHGTHFSFVAYTCCRHCLLLTTITTSATWIY